jgi:hypothetical protein
LTDWHNFDVASLFFCREPPRICVASDPSC